MARPFFLTSATLLSAVLLSTTAPGALASSWYDDGYRPSSFPYTHTYGYDDPSWWYDEMPYVRFLNHPYDGHGSRYGGKRYEDFRCFHTTREGLCTNYQYREDGWWTSPFFYGEPF